MAVDWDAFTKAISLAKGGQAKEGLRLISTLVAFAESDSDRAVLLGGEATCRSHLGQISEAFFLLAKARELAVGSTLIASQIAMIEASLHSLNKEPEIACQRFSAIRAQYADLLANPLHDDFLAELDTRHAYALVDCGRNTDALPIFQRLFARGVVDDLQRVQLYLGAALMALGKVQEARLQLLAAAKGSDLALSQDAVNRLTGLGVPQ